MVKLLSKIRDDIEEKTMKKGNVKKKRICTGKRMVSLLLAGVLLLGISGCGNSGKEEKVEQKSTQEQTSSQDLAESTSGEDWRGSLEDITLSFGTCGTYGPFSYFDADGKTVIGYDIDLLTKLQELLGFEIDDAGIQTMDYSALTTSISEGKIDMVIAALAITEERAEVMNFSDPYYESAFTVLVNKESSPTDITGIDTFLNGTDYKVACGSGTAAHLLLQRIGVPTENIDIYDDIPMALQALEAGKTNAMVYDNAGATYYIKTSENTKLEKAGEPFEEGSATYGVALSFQASEKYPEIQGSINQAISYLKEEGYLDELKTKWCE